ncbi:MAG: YqiA/YcfP family alpha/beta fold hydrolase [Gloeobacterales cyanobacterium]
MRYFYLHGFASGPGTVKGQYYRARFAEQGIPLILPDLNDGDFEHINLTRQLAVIQKALGNSPEPVTLLGSSLGGLLAVLTAIQDDRVQQLVLLAPAFQFFARWFASAPPDFLLAWKEANYTEVFHYGYRKICRLHYDILTDAVQYDEESLARSVPTLIFHGTKDDVVPYGLSEKFSATRPWVKLVLMDSDHQLTDVLETLWQKTAAFLKVLL